MTSLHARIAKLERDAATYSPLPVDYFRLLIRLAQLQEVPPNDLTDEERAFLAGPPPESPPGPAHADDIIRGIIEARASLGQLQARQGAER